MPWQRARGPATSRATTLLTAPSTIDRRQTGRPHFLERQRALEAGWLAVFWRAAVRRGIEQRGMGAGPSDTTPGQA